MVHELEVHKIELELQCEELRIAQQEAEEGRARYHELYDSAPVGCFTFDGQGLIEEVNRTGAVLLGEDRGKLIRRRFQLFLENEGRGPFTTFCRTVLGKRVPTSCDLILSANELRPPLPVRIEGRPGEAGPEAGRLLRAVVIDISKRRLVESELRLANEQLRLLSARLHAVREDERKSLARDLHDRLGQELSALRLGLVLVQKAVSPVSPLVAEKLKGLFDLMNGMEQSVRTICTELRPVVLDHLGILQAIEWQARDFQERTGISTEINFLLRAVNLDSDRSIALFRILQEILTNVTRHANASAVTIAAEECTGSLRLEVRDNGRGITEREVNDPRSLGLAGIRERAMAVGGRVEIVGVPGAGTVVTVAMPMSVRQMSKVRGATHATH